MMGLRYGGPKSARLRKNATKRLDKTSGRKRPRLHVVIVNGADDLDESTSAAVSQTVAVTVTLVMARYIVSYRILRYCGRIVAYLYRDNYPSNEVDIPHNSQECMSHVSISR